MRRKQLASIGVLVLVASLPFWFIQTSFILNVAILAFVFMATAIAWNIISGFGGQVSFGHSIFFGLGAYATGLLFAKLHISPWIGILLGGLLASCIGLAVGYLTFRLRGVYFALATFSLTLIFQVMAVHFDGLTGGDVGLSVPLLGDNPANFQFTNKLWFYYIALGVSAVFFVISKLIYHSRLGLALRSVKDDDAAAKASGVNDFRTKMIALLISAFLTGVAGGVYIQYTMFIDPSTAFGASTATQIAFLAIAGGAGHLWGPVIGTALLVPLQQLFTALSTSASASGISQMLYAMVVIAILLIDPQGTQSLLSRGVRYLKRMAAPSPGKVSTVGDETVRGRS